MFIWSLVQLTYPSTLCDCRKGLWVLIWQQYPCPASTCAHAGTVHPAYAGLAL